MRNSGLEEAQAGIKIASRNINNLRYADDTTLMAESEEELKSLLMKVKVESDKVGLKLNIQKMKIMASGPITLWPIDGETVETVVNFIFLGFKVTADGESSHEIKRHLLLGRKVMTNIDSIFKSRDITLPTKVRLVKVSKFRLKLKKVGKTTRPFRYDLNQIPYDYTVEVRNRFTGLDLIDRVPDELWNEVRDIVQGDNKSVFSYPTPLFDKSYLTSLPPLKLPSNVSFIVNLRPSPTFLSADVIIYSGDI